MKLVVFLSTAPLLARAAPWSDDCKGLSRLAFIVVVVESVVLFLFFVLSLSLCRTVQHQKRRIYAAPRVHVQQSVRHSADTVPADMHDDDTDQAAYLLAPRVPNTLRPGSVSSRSTLLSPALYAYTPSTEHTDLDAHKKDTLAAPTSTTYSCPPPPFPTHTAPITPTTTTPPPRRRPPSIPSPPSPGRQGPGPQSPPTSSPVAPHSSHAPPPPPGRPAAPAYIAALPPTTRSSSCPRHRHRTSPTPRSSATPATSRASSSFRRTCTRGRR
ncbi:hypothetical protein B0H21DRAFT_727732, partial [Amylocystis lapponica]